MTQTMRERLCVAAAKYELSQSGLSPALAAIVPAAVVPHLAVETFGGQIDAILAELREPDEGMVRTGAKTADAIDPYCRWTGTDSFTAMIDHIRSGK